MGRLTSDVPGRGSTSVWLKSFRSTQTGPVADRQKTGGAYYSPYEPETSLRCGVSHAFGGQEAGLSLLTGSHHLLGGPSFERSGLGGVDFSRNFTQEGGATLVGRDSRADTFRPGSQAATRPFCAHNGEGLSLQSFRVEESPEKAGSIRIRGVGQSELLGDGPGDMSSQVTRKGPTLKTVGTRGDGGGGGAEEAAKAGGDEVVQIADGDALPTDGAESDVDESPSRLERLYIKICSHPVYKFFSEGKRSPPHSTLHIGTDKHIPSFYSLENAVRMSYRKAVSTNNPPRSSLTKTGPSVLPVPVVWVLLSVFVFPADFSRLHAPYAASKLTSEVCPADR